MGCLWHHGKNSVEFLFLRIRKLQCFFKVSRNPFPAGSDVTIKTCPFFNHRVPGFEPETFGSKSVLAAFASPRHLTLPGRICVFIPRAISTQPRPQGLLAFQYSGGKRKTLAHSELKRSLIGAFYCAFIRALSLVYSLQNKNSSSLGSSWKLRTELKSGKDACLIFF